MGMTTKQTTAFNLHKAINDNLVAIKAVRVASKDDHFEKTITVEQFKAAMNVSRLNPCCCG